VSRHRVSRAVAPLAAALLGTLLLTHARAASDPPSPAPAAVSPSGGEAWQLRGRRVYDARCYFCHGYSGDARTVASTFLDPPPRDFSALAPTDLARDTMLAAVRDGRAGTAMQGFADLLDAADMQAVVDYVREAFMRRKARPARYHSPVNGWSGEPRSSPAAPFVTGALSPDVPWESLSEAQRAGRRLFDSACVICHARGDAGAGASPWRPEALSNDHVFDPQAAPGHDDDYSDPPFGLHDRAPELRSAGAAVRRGEALYQANCAFCHAADGSGRNWIGAFLVPAPPDFSRPAGSPRASAAELHAVLRRGVPGTSMPAWGSVLSDADIGAVAAYLAAAFPAFRQPPDVLP
jgi:cytochrome c oxidase cbb3-type subunit 3